MTGDAYRAAGVDIDAGNEAARRYAAVAKATLRQGVLGALGGFAGGFAIDTERYPQPVLFSGTDGVGTKLKVAFATGRHDTIGIDCVAMCVNDILTSGADPLYFLDYLATGQLDVDVAEQVVAGVARGCEQSGAALIGGETAEMPGMYAVGEYDVAGFAVGVANRPDIIDGSTIQADDVVIGLAASGFHSNGYSLIRKLVAEAGLDWNDPWPDASMSVADVLLQPTRIYVSAVERLRAASVDIRGMAHLTGGGWPENLPRCLPQGLRIAATMGSWPVPAPFTWLQAQAQMTFAEAARVWNMGIGYAVIVRPQVADEVIRVLAEAGVDAWKVAVVEADNVGTVEAGDGDGSFRWQAEVDA